MILTPQLLTISVALALPMVTASPAPPSFLPELIKRVATDVGVDFNGFDELRNNEGLGNQTINFYPPEYKNALQKGDYDTIARLNDFATRDRNPIIANINLNGESAWTQFLDERTKSSYWLSFSGHPARPDGYMWISVLPASQSNGGSLQDHSTTNVVQVGSMSTNSKFLGITLHTYETASKMGAIIIGLDIAKTAVTKFVQARIAGAQVAVAIRTAAQGAAVEVADVGADMAALVKIATDLLTIGVDVIIIALVLYIYDFIRKEYKGSITIYNWSNTDEYELVAEYGYNEIVADGNMFKKAFLGAVPNKSNYAFTALSTPQASIGRYNFVNGRLGTAAGFGIALEVRNLKDVNDGFRFKYFIHPACDNLIGIAPLNPDVSLEDYYNNDREWSQRGNKEKQIDIGKGTPVLAHMPWLGGSSKDLYPFDVHIGIRRDTVFSNHSAAERPTIGAWPAPQIPAAVENGEEITLPDGSVVTATVAAQPSISNVANLTLILPQDTPTRSVAVA